MVQLHGDARIAQPSTLRPQLNALGVHFYENLQLFVNIQYSLCFDFRKIIYYELLYLIQLCYDTFDSLVKSA